MAEVNSWAALFGQAATQAPQPMHAAASMAASATSLGIEREVGVGGGAGGGGDVAARLDDRSKARRSTTRSLSTGKALARHGSM